MIVLYYNVSSKTSRQAISWFDDYKIEVTQKRVEKLVRNDLIFILSLTENGFSDILKKSTGPETRIHKMRQSLKQVNFNEAVEILLENTDIVKVPIIFDDKKLVIGYNSESIRVFIEKEYRRRYMHENTTENKSLLRC